ncbi:MAG: V-type ATP synthase subunit D [Thermoplasmataceae archaeon]|jgi:V/A-type H+-transporting ATPase subunit D|nr:V-type ATP synthase subunit D [Candidatus Thermoplasmatota archaeon]MCL5439507.1 V-type ATP synthase subunit D [Candidatus Thermoplasmatota archaeon]
MASSEVRPTRIELINVTRRIRLARKGLDLLKMKRTSLVMEFFAISRTVKGMRENIRSDMAASLEIVRLAEALSGLVNLERIAAMSVDTDANVATKNVMGVRIPTLNVVYHESLLSEIYRAVSIPTVINDSIIKFERIFRALLEIAEKENSMRKLLREIDRTKRRSNAIENILIPGLVANAKYIRMRLDEMERETFSMLKAVKRNLEAKNAADGGAF